jgi:hypothetical protein
MKTIALTMLALVALALGAGYPTPPLFYKKGVL